MHSFPARYLPQERGSQRAAAACLAAAFAFGVGLAAPTAAAEPEPYVQGRFTIVPLKQPPEGARLPESTFRTLLRGELEAQLGPRARYVAAATAGACDDAACAARAGAAVGAEAAIYGTFLRLDPKIILHVYVVDVASGAPRTVQRLTIDRVGDLDAAARRVATALARGTSVAEAAELGAITAQESQAPRRRAGSNAGGLRVGAVVPLAGYGDAGAGVNLAVHYWHEAEHFAVTPSLGFAWDTQEVSSADKFREFPIDLAAYYIPFLGDVTPVVGGSVGLHYVRVSKERQATTGTVVVVAPSSRTYKESRWGAAASVRAGGLFLRTYRIRLLATASYGVDLVQLHDAPFPQLFGLDLTMLFSGVE